MARWYFVLLFGVHSSQTPLSDQLNAMIERSPNQIYKGGGKGVLVRNPFDGYEWDPKFQVLPATFWHNDINVPSQMFPATEGTIGSEKWGLTSWNPDCPNDGNNGFWPVQECKPDPGTGYRSAWRYPTVGYVIGHHMDKLFPEFEHIQDDDWGWGVFYATDSNSVDYRCRFLADWQGYDCGPDPFGGYPGGWISLSDGKWYNDKTKQGAGAYPAGNPYADPSWGGGTGCHLDKEGHLAIDQTDAIHPHKGNLVQDYDCQCNYAFNQVSLELSLDRWARGGLLVPGYEHRNSHPGSGTLVVRETTDPHGRWIRRFFCEAWSSPGQRWRLTATADDCFVETYSAPRFDAATEAQMVPQSVPQHAATPTMSSAIEENEVKAAKVVV